MSKQSKLDALSEIIQPAVEELGYDLVDVEFEKVWKDWVLTVFIGHEKGIFIEDCEKVSHKLSDLLDEIDPIEQSYTLEVSSPGIDRPLKNVKDYEKAIDSMIEVKLYQPLLGAKEYAVKLLEVNNDGIVVERDNGEILNFNYEMIAKAIPIIEF